MSRYPGFLWSNTGWVVPGGLHSTRVVPGILDAHPKGYVPRDIAIWIVVALPGCGGGRRRRSRAAPPPAGSAGGVTTLRDTYEVAHLAYRAPESVQGRDSKVLLSRVAADPIRIVRGNRIVGRRGI